jgi:hypothetical protein
VKILVLFILILTVSVRAEEHLSFLLDSSAKRKLVEKAIALKPGDSFQTVTNSLGAPTFDQKLVKKESDEFVGRSLKYYAVIWKHGLVSELHDEYVDVFLDKKYHIRSVHIRVTLD